MQHPNDAVEWEPEESALLYKDEYYNLKTSAISLGSDTNGHPPFLTSETYDCT